MHDTATAQLREETRHWGTRAERLTRSASGDPVASLELVREGILLRRRWDLVDRNAPARRQLLTLLAAAQTLCHRLLADSLAERTGPLPLRTGGVTGRLAEDDQYLADLLGDESLPAEDVAFAIECFRDDLHWLGTLAALLDGSRGIDFTGRVLLEQESLQRLMESWDQAGGESSTAIPEQLRESARDLRATALARQAEALLGQVEPTDCEGWHRAWQAASRLAMRPTGAFPADTQQAVRDYRSRAARRWTESLAELGPDDRHTALRQVADELADAAGEALTFLEDLPLAEGVQTLEILAEDAATCRRALAEHGGPELRVLRRQLRRRRKAIAAELQERRLGWRMERLFGRRAVVALERLILLLLVAFVVMLAVEEPLIGYERVHWPGSSVVETTCALLDLGICLVFLAEFSLKWSLSSPRRLYFNRHWITGLLPAIPVGFIFYMADPSRAGLEIAGELFVLLRALRYLRLPQMARWLRIARPVLRVVRLVAFVMQASDRLVRRVAPLLNRNFVLFDRATIKVEQPPYRTALAALRERFRYRASEVVAGLPPPALGRLVQGRIDDLTAMLSARTVHLAGATTKASPLPAREIPLEQVIARLLAATPAGISERIGRTLAQSVARWCRAFDVFGVRRLPVVRDLVAAGRRSSPYGTTAEVANRIGSLLKHLLDRVYWVADLYGTLTAPQLVDSVGDWLVKGTARPARRFLLFGAAFLAVFFLAGLLPVDPLKNLTNTLEHLVAAPLVILGVLCLLPLLLGLWFRQIAGEATDFCTRVAEAQFLTATKQLKRRFAQRHHAELHRRVIAPEMRLSAHAKGCQGQLVCPCGTSGADKPPLPPDAPEMQRSGDAAGASQQESGEDEQDDPTRAAVELLFEDYLDGAPFHRSDTKTTTQLLGNLALISLRESRLGYGRSRRKRLRRLDLGNTRTSLRGPYLWFHFISRSLAQQTAKLVVDYNTCALPLDRAATADQPEVRCYLDWLSRRLNTQTGQLELAAEFRDRLGNGPDPGEAGTETSPPDDAGTAATGERRRSGRQFHGNEFTAIHFLSADERLDADIRRRYGDQVADLMRRDRRDNIRRVFRTYPLHHWPKRQRCFNPLVLHGRYLDGGRVLLLPFRTLWWSARLAVHGVRLLCRFVAEVLHPTIGDLDPIGQPDPFAVAVRKIHRMRKPVFLECLRMRAQFDPEYLGVSPPGVASGVRRATTAPIEEDLALIGADPGVVREFRALAGECRRQMLDLQRLRPELDDGQPSGGQLPPESLRAIAIAYAIDYRNARTRLEAGRRLRRAFDEALRNACDETGTSAKRVAGAACPPLEPRHGRASRPRHPRPQSLRLLWRRWRHAARMNRLVEQPEFSAYAAERKTCLADLCHRGGPLLGDLRELTRRGGAADPTAEAREVLRAVARDPATWSRQLVVLRAVQTLSVLDLRTYCDLVAELGEYGPCPTEPADGMLASESPASQSDTP